MLHRISRVAALAAIATGGLLAGTASAQVTYEGKTISVYITSAPDGGLDLYGRLFARHASKYLPGSPTMVPKNNPGAGGILLANLMASTLPRDGTAVSALTNGLYLSPLLGTANVRYDAAKFNWVGRLADLPLLLVSRPDSKVKTAADMLTNDFSVATTGPGSYGHLVLSAFKTVLGAKMQIIAGYRSGGENRLAMERGEVDGTASVQWTIDNQRDWVLRNKWNILSQIALTSAPDITNVPLLADLAKDEETRQTLILFIAPAEIGRSLALPPDVPADIVKLYRDSFVKMTQDPELIAEAKKLTLELNVVPGEKIQTLHQEMSKVSPAVLARAKAANVPAE